VVLLAQNSFNFVIAYYAILRADAVVVPLNPMSITEELRRYVKDCGAGTAIVAQELWPNAAPLAADGTIAHAIVAAYSDYLEKPTDLKVADAFKLPRQAIAGSNVTLWRDAIADSRSPSAHTGTDASGHAVHVRHHGRAEGGYAHPPLRMHNIVGGDGSAGSEMVSRRCCPIST
jgi:fatty-acyl-CoA synthase